MRNISKINLQAIVILLIFVLNVAVVSADPKIEITETLAGARFATIHQLEAGKEECFLAETLEENKIIKYCRSDKQFVEEASTASPSHSHSALAFEDKIAIVFGIGRKSQIAALKVIIYDKKLSNPEPIFDLQTDRTEGYFSGFEKGKILFTYFDSKFITKSGFFEKSGGKWIFKDFYTTRLGTVLDLKNNKVVVGRPYGDVNGQDGDLFLIENGKTTLLPTYRGVRGASFMDFNSNDYPDILIGDGWNQNYGQFAQGRISLLTFLPQNKKYALQIIDLDKTQHSFSKFKLVKFKNKNYVFALGSSKIFMYEPDNNWKKTELYLQSGTRSVLNFAYLGVSSNKISLAVHDEVIKLIEVNI